MPEHVLSEESPDPTADQMPSPSSLRSLADGFRRLATRIQDVKRLNTDFASLVRQVCLTLPAEAGAKFCVGVRGNAFLPVATCYRGLPPDPEWSENLACGLERIADLVKLADRMQDAVAQAHWDEEPALALEYQSVLAILWIAVIREWLRRTSSARFCSDIRTFFHPWAAWADALRLIRGKGRETGLSSQATDLIARFGFALGLDPPVGDQWGRLREYADINSEACIAIAERLEAEAEEISEILEERSALESATPKNNGKQSAPERCAAEENIAANRPAATAEEAVRRIGDEWATYAQLAEVLATSHSAIRARIKRADDRGALLQADRQDIPESRPGTKRMRFRIRGVWPFIGLTERSVRGKSS